MEEFITSQQLIQKINIAEKPDAKNILKLLKEYNFWRQIMLDKISFQSLVVESYINNPPIKFPLLIENIEIIEKNPSILNKFREKKEGQNPRQIKYYVNQLKKGGNIFHAPILCEHIKGKMPSDGSYYVRDGAHRLMAYGYYSKKNRYKSLKVYLGIH